MFTSDDVDVLVTLETAMWQTATRTDREWMDAHLAAGFVEFGRSGRRYTRAEVLDLEIGPIAVTLPLADPRVRSIDTDVALVTYRSDEERGPSHRSSVWRRAGDGRWQLEFHHGSPAT